MGSKREENANNAFYDEKAIQACCADSDDIHASANSGHKVKEEEKDGEKGFEEGQGESSVGSMWETNSPTGEDCHAHDPTSDLVTEMDDSLGSAWTDEKHNSYLSSIETSFVEQMYEKNNIFLDTHGQSPKQNELCDPNCAESKLNFLKPMNKVLDDSTFRRDGADIYYNASISLTQAIIGGKITVPTLSGHMSLKIPKGVQPDDVVVLRGKGIPKHVGFIDKGDQYVKFCIKFPTKITERQRSILEEIARDEATQGEDMFLEGSWLDHIIDWLSDVKNRFVVWVGKRKIVHIVNLPSDVKLILSLSVITFLLVVITRSIG